jgi:hypothetical protein
LTGVEPFETVQSGTSVAVTGQQILSFVQTSFTAAALSVLGVAGNAAASVASISGVANQVLRVNAGGTGLGFGAVNLATTAAVTGVLGVVSGGTGTSNLTGLALGSGTAALTAVSYTAVGAWTPADVSGASLTFTSVSVSYSHIGNIVSIYGRVTYPATADTSNTKIGGLPVTVPNVAYAASAGSAASNAGIAMFANANLNTTTFSLFNQTTLTAITNAQMSGRTLLFNFSYPAA